MPVGAQEDDAWEQLKTLQEQWVVLARDLSEHITTERSVQHTMAGHQMVMAMGHLLSESPVQARMLWATMKQLEATEPTRLMDFLEAQCRLNDSHREISLSIPTDMLRRSTSLPDEMVNELIRALTPENP